MSYWLTKSKYIMGLQCEKALWMSVYKPRWAYYPPETLALFRQGRMFEASFKSTFPDGVDICAKLGRRVSEYPQLTRQLLDSEGPITLFEAGFEYGGVLVLADVVCKYADGTVEVYEVKNGTEEKKVFQDDIAIQHYVIWHCIPRLAHFYLLYNDGEGGFLKRDFFEQSLASHEQTERAVNRFNEVLRREEPAIPMGVQCEKPYSCPFRRYCLRGS